MVGCREGALVLSWAWLCDVPEMGVGGMGGHGGERMGLAGLRETLGEASWPLGREGSAAVVFVEEEGCVKGWLVVRIY